MIPTRISLCNIHLHYSSAAFKERSLKSLIGKLGKSDKSRSEVKDIHALKGISLNIKSGERVGLLGRNGAGKSTFLKMVAGLYPPSKGQRIVEGTVRSLFDLSLGFEPDATGRENVLYRGLLLGLSPRRMRELENEIIEFADLGDFIDYPLRTYSAGMQVRLAFSISTAVGGNILLLDEVIGAGDANFMAKTKQRIQQLTEESEILILASHDMASLKSLCNRGVVFDYGELKFDGPIYEAINIYRKINGIES